MSNTGLYYLNILFLVLTNDKLTFFTINIG